MQIDGAVGGQCVEIVGPAVVLIDQTAFAVAHHERRIAARPVADRHLDVDGHGQPIAEIELLAVVGAHDVAEAVSPQDALELAGREPRNQHRGVTRDVVPEERVVEVIGVDVGDVQVVRAFDLGPELVTQPVVAREHEPGTEEGGFEPGIAQDRALPGLDQHPGMTDGCGAHTVAEATDPPRRSPGTKVLHRPGAGRYLQNCEGGRTTWPAPFGYRVWVGQATGGSVYCWPPRATCSVHWVPSQ